MIGGMRILDFGFWIARPGGTRHPDFRLGKHWRLAGDGTYPIVT